MTIQEAIKSGKPFRRKIHTMWTIVSGNQLMDNLVFKKYCPTVQAILADDWEVKE